MPSLPSGYDSHPISGLVLNERDAAIEVVSLADGRRFHILEAFSDLLFAFVMNKASWIPPLRHAPRVLIDKLVIHRETWRFRKDELDFAAKKDEASRFLGARRWMKSHGLPQKAFVKSALEVKPFYVDMESPVLVEILCRAIRRMKFFRCRRRRAHFFRDASRPPTTMAAGRERRQLHKRTAVCDCRS